MKPAVPSGPDRTGPDLDHDALHALAWMEAGMPEEKIGYGPDAPKLSQEQLSELKPASYALTGRPAAVRTRKGPTRGK